MHFARRVQRGQAARQLSECVAQARLVELAGGVGSRARVGVSHSGQRDVRRRGRRPRQRSLWRLAAHVRQEVAALQQLHRQEPVWLGEQQLAQLDQVSVPQVL